MRTCCALCVVFGLSASLYAQSVEEAPHLQRIFEQAGVQGTFVLHDTEAEKLIVHNVERSKKRFRPASTFKIANALIGLETKAVSSVEEVIPYGGTKEYFKSWEKDMDLVDAMKRSNVAVFHQLAKRVGLERMREKVTAFGYGNTDIGETIDQRFWLTGPLEISAREQVAFIYRLTKGKLSVSEETAKAVAELIVHAHSGTATIHAKTGWLGPEAPQIGWWVGWVADGDVALPFALNIDIKTSEDAPKRLTIGKQCLAELGKLSIKE